MRKIVGLLLVLVTLSVLGGAASAANTPTIWPDRVGTYRTASISR